MMTVLEQFIRKEFEERVGRGQVDVAVDPRGPAVVPDRFKVDKVLVLTFSHTFRDAGPLLVTDEGVQQDLHFPATPTAPGLNFVCSVPWRAIFALAKGGGGGESVTFVTQLPCDLEEAAAEAASAPTRGLSLVK